MKRTKRHSLLFYGVIGVCVGSITGCAGTQSSMRASENASSAEELAVMQVIQDLFDAMRAGDGEKVASLFVDGAILQSVGERQGAPAVTNTPIDRFASAVGQPHDQVWDERIWDARVHIDGRLASVWTSYAFYLGDTFSHCGVDSFQMFKDESGWKILYLADTRQREGCQIPESVESGVN